MVIGQFIMKIKHKIVKFIIQNVLFAYYVSVRRRKRIRAWRPLYTTMNQLIIKLKNSSYLCLYLGFLRYFIFNKIMSILK